MDDDTRFYVLEAAVMAVGGNARGQGELSQTMQAALREAQAAGQSVEEQSQAVAKAVERYRAGNSG